MLVQMATADCEQLLGQVMGFQPMSEFADRGFIRGIARFHSRENTHRCVIQYRILGGRVRKLKPLLHKVNAQHRLQPNRTTTFLPRWVVGLQYRHVPRKNALHSFEKDLPARLASTIQVGNVFKVSWRMTA